MERIKRGNLRVDAINKSKRKRKKYITIWCAVLILLLLGMVVLIKINYKDYQSFAVLHTTEWNNTGSCSYMKYRNGIIRATKDGAEAISPEGKKIWNISYDMRHPVIDTCGNYTVVADQGSNTAYIIDDSGKSNMIDTVYPIVEAKVASQGVIALLLNHEEEDYINLYSMIKTEPLSTIKTVVDSDGFPIDIALSEDGKKLTTSYIRVDNEKMVTQVSFYNFGDVGQNHIYKLVGSFAFSSFIPKVEFLGNNVVSVFGENGFSLFSMEEKPSEITKVDFDTSIQDIFYNDESIGFVLDKKDEDTGRRLVIYDLSGKKRVDRNIDFTYSRIAAGEEYVVFYHDSSYTVMNYKGKDVCSGVFSNGVDWLYKGKQKTQFFAVTEHGLITLELSETKEE